VAEIESLELELLEAISAEKAKGIVTSLRRLAAARQQRLATEAAIEDEKDEDEAWGPDWAGQAKKEE
jgi:hypothetical protein